MPAKKKSLKEIVRFYSERLTHTYTDGITIFDKKGLSKYFQHFHTADLRGFNDGDPLIAFISRASDSSSTWTDHTNKYHGYVLVDASIKVHMDGRRSLAICPEDKLRITNPVGKERTYQGCDTYNAFIENRFGPERRK